MVTVVANCKPYDMILRAKSLFNKDLILKVLRFVYFSPNLPTELRAYGYTVAFGEITF